MPGSLAALSFTYADKRSNDQFTALHGVDKLPVSYANLTSVSLDIPRSTYLSSATICVKSRSVDVDKGNHTVTVSYTYLSFAQFTTASGATVKAGLRTELNYDRLITTCILYFAVVQIK